MCVCMCVFVCVCVCARRLYAACVFVCGWGCLRGVGWDSSSSVSVTFARQTQQTRESRGQPAHRTLEATSGGSPELSAGLRTKSNYHSSVVAYFKGSVTLSESVKLPPCIPSLTFTFILSNGHYAVRYITHVLLSLLLVTI